MCRSYRICHDIMGENNKGQGKVRKKSRNFKSLVWWQPCKNIFSVNVAIVTKRTNVSSET